MTTPGSDMREASLFKRLDDLRTGQYWQSAHATRT
jgi:hypothetical protein